MSKHTPGPWSVRLEDGRGNYHVRECALSESHDNPDIALANARLIAAAPDLLEVLEWYAEQTEGCRKVTSEGNEARRNLDKDGGDRARAAIAKAKGEA